MNRELRLAIEESVDKKIVSSNLLYCCIATLNNKIKNSNKNEYIYNEKRECFTKIAIHELKIDKTILANKIINLSQECYPSFKAIDRVYRMVNKDYSIDDTFISDKLMKYNKNTKQIKLSVQYEKQDKKDDYAIQDKDFIEICNFLVSNYNIFLTESSQRQILKIKSNLKCTYNDILKTLQWNGKKIYNSMYNKEFGSSSQKLSYIIGCLKNMVPETQRQTKETEKRNKEMVEWLDREFAERGSRPVAEYKRKTKKENLERFKDLW